MNNIRLIQVFLLSLLASGMTLKLKGEDTKQDGLKSEKPKITVSRETTYFTEPLLKDGSLDCVAVLNKIAKEGVAVDDNAAVMIWQACGPECIPVKFRKQFFKLLGIAELPEKGDYFVEFSKYPKTIAEELAYKQFDTAQEKPWSAKEFPLLASLLEKNEKPLKLISEAVLRPKYYSPFVKTSDEFFSILDIDLEINLRDVARQLRIRAMLRLNNKLYDESWQDLITCYRLGRLVSHKPLAIDMLVGTAYQGMAAEGIWTFLNTAELSVFRSQKYQTDLKNIPVSPDVDKIWQLGERIFEIGHIYDLSNNKNNSLNYYGLLKDKSLQEALKKLAVDPKMDWDEVLRLLNAGTEKFLTVLHENDYAVKRKGMQKLDADIAEECRRALEPASLEKVFSSSAAPKEKARHFVAILSNSGITNYTWMITPTYRVRTYEYLTQLTLAISAYHTENNSYPARLTDLSPKYIAEIPKDPFSSADFKYKARDNGYLLYSVGPNIKDDGGKNYLADNDYNPDDDDKVSEEEKSTDDIAIHVPPKKK